MNVKNTVKELWTVIDRSYSDSLNAEKLIVGIARELDERGLCKRDRVLVMLRFVLKVRS